MMGMDAARSMSGRDESRPYVRNMIRGERQ